jgi:lauroyl/myristoyl acyltransferase
LLKALIITISKLLSFLPASILLPGCYFLGILFLMLQWSRFSLVIKNLRYTFPSVGLTNIICTAVVSTSRSIEQGLLVIAWSRISLGKLREKFTLSENHYATLSNSLSDGNGCIWLIPHFCHADALSFLGYLLGDNNEIHTLYRPFKNKVINDFVKNSRERFGVKTINRKHGGMFKTLRVLKKNQTIAMLFDQNAGGAGTRMKFMGRECSCTTLPDILFQKFKPKVLFVYTKRTAFWSSSIEVEEMRDLNDEELVIEKANDWLEQKLRDDRVLRESWLWLHKRWRQGVGQIEKRRIR